MAKVGIWVGSVFGGAEAVAQQALQRLQQAGHQAQLMPLEADAYQQDWTHVLVCTSTTGQGDVPDPLNLVYYQLRDTLPQVAGRYADVIALGDSSYGDTFAGAGRKFIEVFAEMAVPAVQAALIIDACEESDPVAASSAWLAQYVAKLTD
ncbi:flavodoxin domain-containing protein [Balneatrix alpica]|uniref:flavodoxin domain-containing protein n=1 Tax=Balneatrix alpica TaxID=75684 RepID=UPI002739233E|nr:flavodoxin domain-containing protein [Balneatrix alpica]